MDKTIRLCATVKNRELGTVKHFTGMPPISPENLGNLTPMPGAVFLIIEKAKDGIFLLRFTEQGQYITDTWHESIGHAKEQARYEFDNSPSEWEEVPENIPKEGLELAQHVLRRRCD